MGSCRSGAVLAVIVTTAETHGAVAVDVDIDVDVDVAYSRAVSGKNSM